MMLAGVMVRRVIGNKKHFEMLNSPFECSWRNLKFVSCSQQSCDLFLVYVQN